MELQILKTAGIESVLTGHADGLKFHKIVAPKQVVSALATLAVESKLDCAFEPFEGGVTVWVNP